MSARDRLVWLRDYCLHAAARAHELGFFLQEAQMLAAAWDYTARLDATS